METKQDKNLYIQVWRNPIFYGGLLKIMKAKNLHTFIGLAVFMDEEGKCNPSLERLSGILGISDLGTVSKRITSLERVKYNGLPVLIVQRGKKLNSKGVYNFENNHYALNPEIITIFEKHDTTLIRQEEQMSKFIEMRQKLADHLSISHNGRQTT